MNDTRRTSRKAFGKQDKTKQLTRVSEIEPWAWPEGTCELILDVLREQTGDDVGRILAVEMAGEFTVINDDLVAALLAILQGEPESEEIRCKAAFSLGGIFEYVDIEGFDEPDDVPISEEMFHQAQTRLATLFRDPSVPESVRQRILVVSVRAPQDWHRGAVAAAFASGDGEWELVAVFCMRFVKGFDNEIVQSLKSKDPDVEFEAVCAAEAWSVEAAWSHVCALVAKRKTEKDLLLAAIDAVASIRPLEAMDVLEHLLTAKDEDIVDAVEEALAMADMELDENDDDDDQADDFRF